MVRTFSIVRPYPGQLGKAVEAFVAGLGLTPALGVTPPPGTSDEQTARWLSRASAEFLVVPFHFHRGQDQSRLDGIGTLLALPSGCDLSGRVLFMPVRRFSWTTSFHPRYDLLKSERPRIAEHLIIAQEEDLESSALHLRVRRALESTLERRSRPPTERPRARSSAAAEASQRLTERFSLPPQSVTRRTSGAWKFQLPEEEELAEDQFRTIPPGGPSPVSDPRMLSDPPVGIPPIYEDFIDRKKSNG